MAIEGIFSVNKPAGLSSYDVIRHIKPYCTKKEKIGHAGTLDPFATGVLIIAIGKKYTKTLSTYQSLYKTYRFVTQFGKTTSTLDPEGTLMAEMPVPLLTRASIARHITSFQGTFHQIPPQFSAKKVNGKRAYKEARAGKKVILDAKEITVSQLTILDYCERKHQLTTEVVCSSGTYVRALSRDMSRACHTCGYTLSLARTAIGNYDIHSSYSLETLAKVLR